MSASVYALFLNPKNGFAVIIEAKVLSHIFYEITYDTMRNQYLILRNRIEIYKKLFFNIFLHF